MANESTIVLPSVISAGGIPLALATLAASSSGDIKTGSDLEAESKEEREAKKEKKQKTPIR